MWTNWGEKKHKMAPYRFSLVIHNSWSPEFLKRLDKTLLAAFLNQNLHHSCKATSISASPVRSGWMSLTSQGFQKLGLRRVSCISLPFKASPHLHQLCTSCPGCFVNYETSPDLPTSWRWVDNEWMIILSFGKLVMVKECIAIWWTKRKSCTDKNQQQEDAWRTHHKSNKAINSVFP